MNKSDIDLLANNLAVYRVNFEKLISLDKGDTSNWYLKDELETFFSQTGILHEFDKYIKIEIARFEEFVEDSDKFTINYKTSLVSRLKALNENIIRTNLNWENIDPESKFSTVYNFFNSFVANGNFDAQNILKYTSRNAIIFGENGSGKTSLLKSLRSSVSGNVISINAESRSLHDQIQAISKRWNLNILELTKLKDSHPLYLTDKFDNILKSLNFGKDVLLNIDSVELQNDKHTKYPIEFASDGEKSIICMLMQILEAPQNSYIFIDEPEVHLNTALLCHFFNVVEQEREDCIFVYASHNVDFIKSRHNFEYIFLEKTNAYYSWKTKKMSKDKKIDIEVVMAMDGNPSTPLFCEGTYDSLDYQIYSKVFSNFSVIPVQSCSKVIEKVKNTNEDFEIYGKSYGLIDRDFRFNNEIKNLQENHIYILDYSEIENILIDQDVIEYILNFHNISPNKVEVAIRNAIDKINKEKNNIISAFIKEKMLYVNQVPKVSYDGDTNKLLGTLEKQDEINNKRILQELVNFEQKLSDILENENYMEINKMIPGKFFYHEIIKGINFTDPLYKEAFFRCMKDEDFINMLIDKFPSIPK